MGNEHSFNSILEPWQIPILKLNRADDAPSVFISYSQSQDNTNEHRNWVSRLASKLARLYINVDCDNNVDGHETFERFMAQVTKTKFVICVCSDSYVKKANNENGRTGVRWEIEKMITKGRYCQSPASFIIPIIKNGSSLPFPENLPDFMQDIPSFDFENDSNAKGSFAKIVVRILSINSLIREKLTDEELYKKNAMKILKDYYNALAGYWISESESEDEELLREKITSGYFFNLPKNEKKLNYSRVIDDNGFLEKNINLLGRWDLSYSGDQEIFKLLIGDSEK